VPKNIRAMKHDFWSVLVPLWLIGRVPRSWLKWAVIQATAIVSSSKEYSSTDLSDLTPHDLYKVDQVTK